MRGYRSVGMRLYRSPRLELFDCGGEGGAFAIHWPGRTGHTVLRNAVPKGLPVLLDEARQEVDRALDGAEWHRQP